VKGSDEAEFREYVGARLDQLRRVAYLMCHDWHTADDVVAVTLDKLFQRWRQARNAANVNAYVNRMLINAWLDERRRPWRRETVTEVVPERAAPKSGSTTVDETGIMSLLRSLPARNRAVLILRFYCDLSVEETAQVLDIPAGTVKSQTARGLEALRAAIDVRSGVR
jgi:RNA polymerase sigma-70 factor (sigma-E family)